MTTPLHTRDAFVEKKVLEFEEAMSDGSLFRTKLNYNNLVVQHVRTPEIQNWLRA